jgi:hypothetical protein
VADRQNLSADDPVNRRNPATSTKSKSKFTEQRLLYQITPGGQLRWQGLVRLLPPIRASIPRMLVSRITIFSTELMSIEIDLEGLAEVIQEFTRLVKAPYHPKICRSGHPSECVDC